MFSLTFQEEIKMSDLRIWFPVSKFPTPGVHLLVRLADGSTCEAVRPSYVASYKSDPNYQDLNGNQLVGVIEWSIL